ncbi:MAG: ABC transporter substrate-binding protein, partial [Deltaproteobacteria bacterium]|nr:ABC transporter substrate-binding protein [Deltaproteobacteria bacterium]
MKPKTTYRLVCLLALLISAVFVLGTSAPVQAGTKKLKVGMLMPLSGPISIVGVGLTRAVELYFDKVNEEGGLKLGGDTYMLELIAEDSKIDPTVAATATKKLVYKDECKFVFGAIAPPVAAAIYQVCARAKALHLITWIDAPGLPGDVSAKKPYAVRLCISSDAGWEMDYDFLKENYPTAKRLFIVAPDLGLPVKRAMKLAKERGLTVVGHELWAEGTADFLPFYTKALATKPDVIQAMCSAQAGYQLRTARQLGFKGVFISDAPTAPALILSLVGHEGSYDVISNGMDMNSATPSMKECMERWSKKYKEPFFSDSIITWVEAEVFVQALKKANSIKPEKVVAAFDSMTAPGSFQTAFGPGHMGGANRFGVNRVVVRPMPISRLMNGKIQFVG